MSDRIEWFPVVCQPNTFSSNPQVDNLSFPQGEVTQIDVIIPPGPAGNVGFQIAAGGSRYIPRNENTFIQADDKFIQWPIKNAINSGSWACLSFNHDIIAHTLQIGFHVDEVGPDLTQQGQIIGQSSAALASVITSPALTPGG